MLSDILKCDLRIINLETSVTTSNEKFPNKAFNYRMHPENLKTLTEASINYVSLANNHTLDFGYSGLEETIQSLNKANIKWSGAGRNIMEALKGTYLKCSGYQICCFSFADHPNIWCATEEKPGINYLDIENIKDLSFLQQIFEEQKNLNVDIILVSIHWGSNYNWYPSMKFQEFAHSLLDFGANIIHGHSSHHIQGIEIYKGKPIFYGCGDFIDDYAVDFDYRNDLGFGYFLTWKENKIIRIELQPIKIIAFRVQKLQVQSEEYDWLTKKMYHLCEKFATKLEMGINGNLFINLE